MSGTKLLLDTNIALYLLSGDQVLAALLDQKDISLSIISEMELLGYYGITAAETLQIKAFLKECQVIDINPSIKDLAIEIRKAYQLKLPDAIIAATALHLNLSLISSDAVFKRLGEMNFVFYEL